MAKSSVISEAQLRLLNGHYGNKAMPGVGQLVKTVVAGSEEIRG